MKDTKTKHNFYAPWEYEKEEQDLNEASKNGWQLTKGGCFHSNFRMDINTRYIYQIDYNTSIGDSLRYTDIFGEQGWEYINSTYNGWHYFRKKYAEGMDESETHIYTDKESLSEMQNRWLLLVMVIDIMYLVFTVSYFYYGLKYGSISILAEAVLFGLLALTFSLGIISARRKRAGKQAGFIIPMQIVVPLALVALTGILVSGFFR